MKAIVKATGEVVEIVSSIFHFDTETKSYETDKGAKYKAEELDLMGYMDFTMMWVPVKERKPAEGRMVLLAYEDESGENKGVSTGSLDCEAFCEDEDDVWSDDDNLAGEEFWEEDYTVTHWCDYQHELVYPDGTHPYMKDEDCDIWGTNK